MAEPTEYTAFTVPSRSFEEDRSDTSPGPPSREFRLPPPLDTLAPGERVTVRTRNSTYFLVMLRPADRRVLVRGGPYFPRPTEAELLGCEPCPREGTQEIGVRLSLAIGHRVIRTSPVVAVFSEREGNA